MSKFILLIVISLGIRVNSQANLREHISGFNMISFTYKHNKKWAAYIELQDRSIEDFSIINYYEMKGGIGYNLNKNNQILIGSGKYGTYKNAVINQIETRIWLQYIFSQNIGRWKLDHRIRLEKRFFYFPKLDNHTNDERYRYRLSAMLPINSEKIKSNTFFMNAFEEIFFAPIEPNFKRNRIFGGFGYQFNDYVSTNLGYLWQREFSATTNRNLHFLYFGLNFTFDRLKYHENQHIPVAD